MGKVLKLGLYISSLVLAIAGMMVLVLSDYRLTLWIVWVLMIPGYIGLIVCLVSDLAQYEYDSLVYKEVDLINAMKAMRTHTKGNYMIKSYGRYVGVIVKTEGNSIKKFNRKKDCLKWFRREGYK